MTCSDIIDALLAILLVVASVFNLYLLRINSSEKPFLKPFLLGLEPGFSPKIKVINFGPGHAIKVEIIVTAKTDLLSPKIIKKFKLQGPDFIPYIDENNYGIYISNQDIAYVENMMVIIKYQSDSGFKRKTIWQKVNYNLSNEMFKNEEFILEKTK